MKSVSTRLSIACASLIAISLVLTGSSYAILEPVGIWLLNEDSGDVAEDFSGKGNNGTVMNGAERVNGKFGKALSFDGKDDHVTIPYDPSIALGDIDYTLSAWIYPEGANDANNWRGIISHLDSYPAGYCLRLGETADAASNKVFCFYGDVDSWEEYVGATTLDNDKWYHVAATYSADSNTIEIYVDGVAEGSLVFGGQGDMVADDDAVLKIGEDWPGQNRYFKGIIDDVGIFAVAMTEDQIVSIMNNGIMGVLAIEPSDKLTATWGRIKEQ